MTYVHLRNAPPTPSPLSVQQTLGKCQHTQKWSWQEKKSFAKVHACGPREKFISVTEEEKL